MAYGTSEVSISVTSPIVFTCNTHLIVTDHEAPSFRNCTASFSKIVLVENGSPLSISDLIVTWVVPNATDNVGVTRVVSNHSPGQIYSIGVTNVSYQAFDQSNNVGFCNFSFTLVPVNASDVLPMASPCPAQRTLTPDSSDMAFYEMYRYV